MKITILSSVFAIVSFAAFSQHNYLIKTPSAQSTFIRDAVVLDNESLLCALDLRMKDKPETAIALMNTNGSANWAKRIEIESSQKVFGYDVIAHNNGTYYAHGLAIVDYHQYAFVLKITSNGALDNFTFFDLGPADFHAINKMKLAENGDLILSLSHLDGVSFVRMTPEGTVKWGKTIDRQIYGSGKQPGYDVQILDDGSIIACGKNNYHFGILKISADGRVIWDQDIAMGSFSHAKTIQALPDGDLFVTGDYVRDNSFTSFIMKVDGNNGTALWAKELDQFDGSFQYQQTELVEDEIHLSMMGNNDPSKMNPDLQNYYVRLNLDGNVIKAYRNGERYNLADYQRLIRTDKGSMIYGSAYNDNHKIEGMVHSYQSHQFDACYWTELGISTSPVSQIAEKTFGAYHIESFSNSDALNISLVGLTLKTEGTCEQVWDESTVLEEENAMTGNVAEEKALMENHEFVVFPNPNNGIFTIRTTYQSVNTTILDISGKVIYQNDQLENNDRIDLSTHPTGMYIMQIITETETFIRRVQVK